MAFSLSSLEVVYPFKIRQPNNTDRKKEQLQPIIYLQMKSFKTTFIFIIFIDKYCSLIHISP